MMKSLSRILMTSCLMAIAAPASAATEADIRGWLNKTVPPMLMIDPAQANLMQNKQQFFTPEGFNGFSKTLERQGVLQTPRQVAALCVTEARMAEGGTWIVTTQVVFKNPQALMQMAEPPADKTAPPKPKPNPFSYETAQFYMKDVASAPEVKVNQYIPEAGPKEGFPGCRAPGEVEQRTSTIDEQLAFYESTLATLNERIAKLRAEKAAIVSGAPMPQQVVPPAPQQIAPPPIAPVPVPAPTQGMGIHGQQAAPQPQQLAPTAAQANAPASIDANASEHILRAPASAVPVQAAPVQPAPQPATPPTYVIPQAAPVAPLNARTSVVPANNYAQPYPGAAQQTR